MSLRVVPVYRDRAFDFITAWHRHHQPPPGFLFAIGAAQDDTLVGVATAGRPVSRHLDDGLTIEVTRVATTGEFNACSMLYRACWRSAKHRGYHRAVTYTRSDEGGASLRAAGWLLAAKLPARPGWDVPSRRRDTTAYEPVDRRLWVITSARPNALPTRTATPECGSGSQPDDLFGGSLDHIAA